MHIQNNKFILLTLATNGKPVIISIYNIAVAMLMEEENNSHEMEKFTRIFLKEITIDDELNWVDVKEPPEVIMANMSH